MERMVPAKNVDAYIRKFPEAQQRSLQQIRQAIKAAAPDAEEIISYGMAGYKQNRVLVYFGGFTNHNSFFPASYAVIKQFSEELKSYKTSKGTIQLPLDKPVPATLIKKMVKARLQEVEVKLKAKAAKKKTAKSNS